MWLLPIIAIIVIVVFVTKSKSNKNAKSTEQSKNSQQVNPKLEDGQVKTSKQSNLNESSIDNGEEAPKEPKKSKYERYEMYPLYGLADYIYGKYYEDKKAFKEITGLAYPAGGDDFISKAYFYNLLFSPIDKGGFGYPIEKRDKICKSDLYTWFEISAKTNVYAVLNKISNKQQTEYEEFAFLKIFKEKGLLEFANKCHQIIARLSIFLKTAKENKDGSYSRFMKNYYLNPDSFLYDKRLYNCDNDTQIKKLNTCALMVINDLHIEYGLFKKDENGEPTAEYITMDDILKYNTSREIADFLDYSQTLKLDD